MTRKPRIERLIPEVTLEAIEPPLMPGGPAAAMLRVRTSLMRDLMYGDRFGTLSATVLSAPEAAPIRE